ncbi:MAG: S8 family serine peptidase [Gemmatimonadetes bacterium]|nr:S8 family serine peptidase [Gemmatimonadota bacterium]
MTRRSRTQGFFLASVALFLASAFIPSGTGTGPRDVSRLLGLGSVAPDSLPYWLFFSESGWAEVQRPGRLEEIPGRVRVKSQWLTALSVDVPADRVSHLGRVPGVEGVRPVGRLRGSAAVRGLPSGRRGTAPPPYVMAPVQADTTYGQLGTIMDRLEIPPVHGLGFLGTGTRIGILDGHFFSGHAVLRGAPPLAVRDFVEEDASVEPRPEDPEGSADHGTGLWSIISADLPGFLTGAAPGSQLLLARIRSDDDPLTADEDRWVAGLEWLESQGARVVLSGVAFRNFGEGGYTAEELDGDVAPATTAADEAARRGVLVVAPVGNGGPAQGTLGSPADGDSVLAVGSINTSGILSAFSARGPTSDGRPKPDLVAPGEEIPVATGSNDNGIAETQGTEFAAALLAGAAALFVEAYPERGPVGIVRALELSVVQLAGSSVGMPRVAPAVLFPDGVAALPLQEVTPEGRVTSLAPQFRWNVPTTHPLGLPVTFHLEIAGDSLFQEVLLSDSVVGTFARRLQEALPPRREVYWRLEARSIQGVSRFSAPSGPIQVPAWVSLDVLNDPRGTEIAEPQPDFRWTSVDLPGPSGPFTFELQVASDRDGEVIQSYSGLQDEHQRLEEPLPFNVPFRWSVIAETRTGAVDTVTSAGPFVVTGGENPPVTILYQNFPNPFPNQEVGASETRIWFDLAEHSRVELAVYDMRGRLVRTLIPARGCGPTELPPGLYGREEGPTPDPCTTLSWNGRDDGGRRVAPGVYLLRLQAGGVVEVRRVVFWP